ncbi:MAG: ATP synthase F1 subunit delta [Bacteroidota bacterium]|nr:ATP synthase F1 subunit delta [Bacteroidota bacterium]
MDYSKIGVRYAKALFQYAEEQKVTDVIVGDMRILFDNLKQNFELTRFLCNPVVKMSEKKKFVDTVYLNQFHKISVDFLKLVIHHRREEHLIAMCRRVEAMYREKFGIRELKLVSVIEINQGLQEQIEKTVKTALNVKSLNVSTEINPDLIGGFVLDMDDLRYDASVKTQLASLRNRIVK